MLERQNINRLVIQNGRLIDPYVRRDQVTDIAIVNGIIAPTAPRGTATFDAAGCIVCPGLMDIHVHLREPGQTHKETIETGTAAAAAGGMTYIACMPNTTPPLDSPDVIKLVLAKAEECGYCVVGPVGTITVGRRGVEVADFSALKEAGAIAFSDDGAGVEDDRVMKRAFERAAQTNAVLIQHCEYQSISAGGVMHLGEVSSRLGVPGLDPQSEEAMIERDLDLCGLTGARYHVAHISTAKAVSLVAAAKVRGLPVTAEVCTHHLLLTDQVCEKGDPNTKMHPPLRPQNDVDGCRRGLIDGSIDCVVTDHAPHARQEKARGFVDAPPGIVGLETAISLTAKAMIDTGLADWPDIVKWFSANPRLVLGQREQAVKPGRRADLTIIDPSSQWTVDIDRFHSKGRNTPFEGWPLTGRTLATIRGREVILVGDAAKKFI